MRQVNSQFLTILLILAACGDSSSSDESGLVTATLTETGAETSGETLTETSAETSDDSGDGDCTPGTPYCECFEGMCFEGLICNDDNHCIPDAPPPMDSTGGEDDGNACTPGTLYCECDGALGECDEGLVGDYATGECVCIEEPEQDECIYQADCPWGEVCYTGDLNWCGSLELTDWQVSITAYDIDCYDGVGTCEYLFYKERWDWDLEYWTSQDFTNIQNPATYDWLRVDAWEDDAFSNDYLNSFQVQMSSGVEAWKNGEAYVSFGDIGSDTMDLSFEPM